MLSNQGEATQDKGFECLRCGRLVAELHGLKDTIHGTEVAAVSCSRCVVRELLGRGVIGCVLVRVLAPGQWRYISNGLAEDRVEMQPSIQKWIAYQWLRGDVLLVNTTPSGVRRSHAS